MRTRSVTNRKRENIHFILQFQEQLHMKRLSKDFINAKAEIKAQAITLTHDLIQLSPLIQLTTKQFFQSSFFI